MDERELGPGDELKVNMRIREWPIKRNDVKRIRNFITADQKGIRLRSPNLDT